MKCSGRLPIGITTSSRWVIPAPSTATAFAPSRATSQKAGSGSISRSVREAGTNRQRCGDAGARRLRWRPHALSGARHGSRHDARHRARRDPARARLPAVHVEGDHGRAPRRERPRDARPRGVAAVARPHHRDAARIVLGRLRRARRRQRHARRGAAAGTRRGGNDDAFSGGFRLWEEMVEPHDRKAPPVWRVVR